MSLIKKVVFLAKDDSIQELKSLLESMIEASRAEDGCELYNIYQMRDRPNTFIVIESWESEEALKGHQNSPHYIHYKGNYQKYTADKYSDELLSLG